MRRASPLLGASLLVLTAAEPLLAQQRLFALAPREIVEVDTRLATLGRVLKRAPTPAIRDSWTRENSPTPVAGGTLIVWASGGGLAVWDPNSGVPQQYALPGFTVGRVLGTDASSFRVLLSGVFGDFRGGVLVADLRSGTTRLLDLGPFPQFGPVAYAWRSDVLFVGRRTPPEFLGPLVEVDVISVATGAVMKTLSVPSASALDFAANADGTRLFVTGLPSGLFAFDVVSGALVATNPAYVIGWGPPAVDDGRERLMISESSWSGAALHALAADTLQPLGQAELPQLNAPPGRRAVLIEADVNDRSATVYAFETILTSSSSFGARCEQSTLAAIDVDTGRLRAAADMSAVTGTSECDVELVRLTEPGPPAALNANVSGRRVSFTWAAEPATHYELEAGTAPGLANLARVTVTDTQLTVDDMPPGVYHVRVRAVNVIGKSAPSQEIRVVVQ